MSQLYSILAVPFGFLLHLFYQMFSNYWIALFMLVILVKVILLPSTISQQKSSAKQIRLQPKVNRIKAKYSNGGNMTREQQAKVNEETQDLYKKEGYSAMTGGCVPMLIQFPVMIGLYGVVYTPLSKVLSIADNLILSAANALSIDVSSAGKGIKTYEITLLNKLTAANMPSSLQEYSSAILRLQKQFNIFGIDLTQTPKWSEFNTLWIIPIVAFLTALLTSVLMFQKQKQTNPEMAKNPAMGCTTFLMSPVMSLIFTFMFPAGVGVYWIMSNILTFFQTLVLNWSHSPQKVIATTMVDETVYRRSREANVKKLKEFSDANAAES